MTDDDAILKQLGARAREQRAEDGGAAAGIPAFDAAAEDRMTAFLLDQPGAQPNAEAEPRATPAQPGATPAQPGARPAEPKVIDATSAGGGVVLRPRRWLYAAAPLAVAAAFVLVVATRGSGGVGTPAYEVSMVSASQVRGPTSATTADATFDVDPDGELELIARPSAPVKNAHARAFLVRSGDAKPWPVRLEISDEGAVRASGTTRVLFPTTTEPYEVVILVGSGDVLPSDADARKLVTSGSSGHADAKFRVVRAKIRFVEKK